MAQSQLAAPRLAWPAATCRLTTTLGQSYLNVKAGQWIMLSQLPVISTFNPNAPAPTPPANSTITVSMHTSYWYRWYKIVATGAIQGPATGPWYRNVTLSGPDWIPNPGSSADAAITFLTYASIFDGVVAVYEKEIQLEQSGALGAELTIQTRPAASEGRATKNPRGHSPQAGGVGLVWPKRYAAARRQQPPGREKTTPLGATWNIAAAAAEGFDLPASRKGR